MPYYDEALNFDKLRSEFNITDLVIKESGFKENELSEIYLNYIDRYEQLVELNRNFLNKYIVSADNLHIHSYSGRVKDPYHLIEKIIRKRYNNDTKYAALKAGDYYKYITDLMGCRVLLVYKEYWENIHRYFESVFPNDPSNYINVLKYAESYDRLSAKADLNAPFMAEKPVIYIREGDDKRIYENTSGTKIEQPGYYRSVHYIVRYGEYYVEIQVRTLFEEAWGEVDHDILYPLHKDDQTLVEYSSILSRVSGLGDEMSTYFKNKIYLPRMPGKYNPLDVPSKAVYTTADGVSARPHDTAETRVPVSEVPASEDSEHAETKTNLEKLINGF